QATGGGGRDVATGVDHRPEPAAGSGAGGMGADPSLRREPDPLGGADAGLPGFDALLRGTGGTGEEVGAQRRVPAGTRGDGAPAGVHAGEPGDARRVGDDPLLPRAAVAPRFVPASQDDLGPSGAKA